MGTAAPVDGFGTHRMDKDSPSSGLDVPVQVSDDGNVSVVFTDSEQWDLRYDANRTGWQGRSIPSSSIGGSELEKPSVSNEPRRTSTTRRGAVIGVDFHAERSVYTDDASAAGRTYDDIINSPPRHLRCVVSPLSSLSSLPPIRPPVHRRVTTEFFNRRRPGVETGSGRALRLSLDCLVLDV